MIYGEITENGFKLTVNVDATQRMAGSINRNYPQSSSLRIYNKDIIAFLNWLVSINKYIPSIDLNSTTYSPQSFLNFTENATYDINPDTITTTLVGPNKNILAHEEVILTLQKYFVEFVSFLNWIQLARYVDYCKTSNHEFDAASMGYIWIETGNRLDVISALRTKENNTLVITDYNQELAIKVIDKTNIKYQENLDVPQYLKTTLGEYIKVVMNMRKDWLTAIKNAELNAIRAKELSVSESLRIISEITGKGWKVEKYRDRSYFMYDQKIIAKRVYDKSTGHLFDLPEELIGTLYLNKIAIPVESKINGTQSIGIGCHPHGGDSNSSNWGGLCVGDLAGQPISSILKAPEMFETIFTGSMFGNIESVAINILFGQSLSRGYENVPIIDKYLKYKGLFIKRENENDADGEVFNNRSGNISRAVFGDTIPGDS